MSFPIENKLVIGISSSALFDLSESDKVFREEGEEAYRRFQEEHFEDVLEKGVAFPFIRRFLNLNKHFPETEPMEVVLLSRNSPETGLRVFRSIQNYGLNITRAAFFSGTSPFKYNDAFNLSLFLSANKDDVQNAVKSGFPAGLVLNNRIVDDENDNELRIAFDFDGVIADDEAEKVYQESGGLDAFNKLEILKKLEPHHGGPLSGLFQRISFYQNLEREKKLADPSYVKMLKIAIVTARNAPAHERMVNTLKSWNISVDEAFFLGGIEKKRVLEVMKPHIYFDDQIIHLHQIDNIPMVHIPFGVTNAEK
jgi:5'-nucleotidase